MGEGGGFLDIVVLIGEILIVGYSTRTFKSYIINYFDSAGLKVSPKDDFLMSYMPGYTKWNKKKTKEIEETDEKIGEKLCIIHFLKEMNNGGHKSYE
jgi:hypothetical protein